MSAPPDFVVGKIIVTDYLDGRRSEAGAGGDRFIKTVADPGHDLQSAGLTAAQLASLSPPASFHDPLAPTAAEIRRLAIYNDYRGLMETTKDGGFGLLFGRAIDGKVFGREYIAFARPAPNAALITLMAQIPEQFDANNPMIVTAPSSGSRGVYGAISMAEWAFSKGCAIAYTDKGTAPGFHDLDCGVVYGLDGLRLPTGSTDEAVFRAAATTDLEAYRRELPHRLAIKHAHSGTNIESRWGCDVLRSIAFCLFCLNDFLGKDRGPFSRANTKVIAAGVSNGGGAALLAAEQDSRDEPLIDAVVVSEPQVQPGFGDFAIRYGDALLKSPSRSFLDTVTLMDVYAPCAAFALDTGDPSSALQRKRADRCAALSARGLLKAQDTMGQAREALDIIHQHGLLPEADFLLPGYEALGIWPLLAAVFSNAYAKAGVTDHLCGVSMAPVDVRGAPTAMPDTLRAQLCGWSNGLGYLVGPFRTSLIDDQAVAGWSLGAALCFRSLVTGVSYPRQNDVEARWIDAGRMQAGIGEVKAKGNLRGKPAIILHGRSDGLLPPNHTSRAYFGLNRSVEKDGSRLSYLEVVGGNHFDSFIPLLGANRLVPMHYYFEQALTLMRDHLLAPASHPLPMSQVVSATASHKPWTSENYKDDLPDIAMDPPHKSRIEFHDKVVTIPSG